MANYILADVREILVENGYASDRILTNQVIEQTNTESGMQDLIILVEESGSQPIMGNVASSDFALYLRRQDPETAETDIRDIYHLLHGRRGNTNTVANSYSKINIIQALTRPYVYSVETTGGNMLEYVIKFRVQYVDTDFDNI